jgi:hypothetical protein
MVKGEGWLDKAGSKWKTMPEVMFQYRAASYFGNLFAPDIMNGMYSVEEVKDFVVTVEKENQLETLQSLYLEKEELIPEEDKPFIEAIIQNQEEASYAKAIKQLSAL